MKLFFHIRDHGAEIRNAEQVFLLGDPAILWSPPFYKLEEQHEKGEFRFSPDELLELVEAGCVKVGVREGWLDHTRRRLDASWKDFEWHPNCDTKLSQLLKEDSGREKEEKRVFELGRSIGTDRAAEIFDLALNPDNVREREKVAIAEAIIDLGRVPQGNLIRYRSQLAGKAETREYLVKQVLRDGINYTEAQKEIGYEINFCTSETFPFADFLRIGEFVEDPTPKGAVTQTIEKETVYQVADLLKSLAGDLGVSNIRRIKENKQATHEIDGCLHQDFFYLREIPSRIQKGLVKESFFEEVFLSTDWMSIASGAAFSAYGLLTSFILHGDFEPLGIKLLRSAGEGYASAVAHSAMRMAMRKLSLIHDDKYEGPAFASVVAGGGKNATRKQLVNALERLQEAGLLK